jgi:Tol biopolymer transport system component
VRRLGALFTGTLCLLTVAVPAPAAARREHTVHGTVRKLCDPVDVRKWPSGPSVGRVAAGKDLRRYHFEGSWALGVTTRRPIVRGYVLTRAFCPPSAAGRRALAAARRLAASPPRGRPGTPLDPPRLRRICAPVVYLRDRPLNRAIALLYAGDTFRATRLARNPWLGGLAHGHARRRGWAPRSAFCHGLDRRAPGYRPVAGGRAGTVLAPPAVVRCGARVSGRPMLQVGVRGSADVAAELRDHAGAVVSSARFVHGRRGRWSYAAAGPYRCGASYAVVYRAPGATVRFAVTIAAAGGPGLAAAAIIAAGAVPTTAVARSTTSSPAGTGRPTCMSTPQRPFAHGGRGPVDHRFHARPAISADGRRVAFDLPAAGLVPRDHNHARDVFVRDVATGRTRLVSVALRGSVGNGTSRAAAMSADGRFVAFESSASDLVVGDEDGLRDVFVRDLRNGTTRLVGPGRSPTLSGDGRLVAYESTGDIDVADLRSGAIRRVADAGYRPSLSADGRYVAFESRVDRGRDANRNWDVYRVALTTGATELLSAGPDGRSGRGQSLAAVLSADGDVAAFQSDAPLARGDRSGLRDVYVRDVRRRRTILVSANRCGRPADGYSRYPSIAADGRRVAFDSHATDLVPGAPRGRGQVYLHDLPTGRTRVLSTTPTGRASERTSFSPALAASAAVVAFPSFAYDLGPRDTNRRVDVYVRSVVGGSTLRVSRP